MMQSGADERILDITPELRLRRYAGECDFALEWYSDPELVFLVDGVREPYTSEKLHRMYDYLNVHGELYFIEAKENGEFRPRWGCYVFRAGYADCDRRGRVSRARHRQGCCKLSCGKGEAERHFGAFSSGDLFVEHLFETLL